ncbi:hypothetical protein C427_1389 [Paraglaciecola psychrophila 170]|uniref:Uncharacterized protein n=1 Tax=Paraglaciecola psychrophila 170 TaxID=1129794 RepID=K6ZVD9_9ALTE|nr:hypothetical protein C427_1389 [Paraglaciecola psychrophila 170]GAC39826.1 hypothetical protein GPSY_4215 [Paraglaciecola psychrophila 170]
MKCLPCFFLVQITRLKNVNAPKIMLEMLFLTLYDAQRKSLNG